MGKGVEMKKAVGHSDSVCRWKYAIWLIPSVKRQTEETVWFSLEIFS